ncbi:MAG TPA: hypothetical protein VK890_11835, partial [Bacteroidia bacterium]|nr:hypothetical protein [Bacteroidia bacterium]
AKIESYTDASLWQKTDVTSLYPWIIDEGPKVIASWRELAALISLMNVDQYEQLVTKWEQMLALLAQSDTLELAMKFKKQKIFTASEVDS